MVANKPVGLRIFTGRMSARAGGLAILGLSLVLALSVTIFVIVRHHNSAGASQPTSSQSRSASNSADVFVLDCTGNTPARQPPTLDVTCGDGTFSFAHIVWSSWSSETAVGSGTLGENNCDPTCAAGHTATERATVTLSAPTTVNGKLVYSKMSVAPDAPNAAKFDTITQTVPQ